MEIYPIMIDGELAGKLRVERQGARTAFDAECRMLPGLVRLSVYGGGQEGYLGVLAPEDGALRLRRVLSRSQMRGFPAEIESAERAGLDRRPEPPPEPETEEAQGAGSPHGIAPEETASQAPDDAEMAGDTAVPADPSGLDWYASPDGALVCFDGTQSLIALPPDDPRVPEGVAGERRTVEGREYIVFPARDGGIIR